MRDQSVGVNLVGRDVSASKTLKKVGTVADKLRKTFALTSAAAGAFAVKLGKDSVAAALADQKELANLNKVLSNSGFGASTVAVSDFINEMQLATGVAEDQLRPAFVQLFSALGSVTRAQDTLRIAMDTSAATGKSLSSVTAAIAKAASGSKMAISRLGLGIDKTTLSTMSFDKILGVLTTKFGGSAATAAETLAGKFDRVKVAVGEAKEEIGKGLLDAFSTLAMNGGSDIDSLTQKIIDMGTAVGDFARGVGILTKRVNELGQVEPQKRSIWEYLWKLTPFLPSFAAYAKEIAGIGAEQRISQGFAQAMSEGGGLVARKLAEAKTAEAEAAAAKRIAEAEARAAAKLAAAKAKEAAARKKAADQKARELRIAKLAANFDSTLIGINAAKKRNEDKDIAARLDVLNVLAQDQAGLPVSDAALKAATTQVNNITVNAGSILTEQELLQKLALSMQAQIRRNDSGQIYWARL